MTTIKDMPVLSIMKHPLTEGQIADGGYTLPGMQPLIDLCQDFPTIESVAEAPNRAWRLAVAINRILGKYRQSDYVNVAGASWLVVPLCKALKAFDLIPVQSFSQRICVETPQADGTVTLSYVFEHEAWVVLSDEFPYC
jgi:hypothetical protein